MHLRLALALLVLTLGCRSPEPPASTPPSSPGTAVAQPNPIEGSIPAAEQDGNWVRPARDFASTRFSQLDQINTGTVGNLAVSVTFSTGAAAGHEAPPLVVDGTMFVVTPWPNVLYALDLTRPGAPVKFAYLTWQWAAMVFPQYGLQQHFPFKPREHWVR